VAPVGEVVARGHGPESWRLDRRVEITVLSQDEGNTNEGRKERTDLIETLKHEGIHDERVLKALRAVPRHELVPQAYRSFAYENRALPIGEGQTISQPYIVALMTQLAHIEAADKVLEIGTGSGYQAAVLSLLAEEVYTIEIIESLGQRAQGDLERLGLSDNIHFKSGDGFAGWPQVAPFDSILVTAAPEEVPAPLVEQLREGGRMIIPVGDDHQELLVLEKKQGELVQQDAIPVRFVPMTGKAQER
jgi:protein-L-isoaspartate(D-aspartate) O-methyltransferase